MDTRSSSLIAALYVAAALAIGGIVAVGFYSRPSRLEEELARQQAEAAKQRDKTTPLLRRNAVSRQEFLAAESAAEVERLHKLLEEKNKILEERTSTLKQRTAAYQKLQQDFDAAAQVLLESYAAAEANASETPGDPAAATEASGDAAGVPPATATEPAPTEVAAMREELSKARLLETTLSADVEQLQAEVLAAETEIARIQEESRLQTEQLLARERLLREAASETLLRIGEPATAALIEALRDEDPLVRRWAASMLADLGPAAPAAIGPLMDALADRDESVRTAAALALRAVSARE